MTSLSNISDIYSTALLYMPSNPITQYDSELKRMYEYAGLQTEAFDCLYVPTIEIGARCAPNESALVQMLDKAIRAMANRTRKVFPIQYGEQDEELSKFQRHAWTYGAFFAGYVHPLDAAGIGIPRLPEIVTRWLEEHPQARDAIAQAPSDGPLSGLLGDRSISCEGDEANPELHEHPFIGWILDYLRPQDPDKKSAQWQATEKGMFILLPDGLVGYASASLDLMKTVAGLKNELPITDAKGIRVSRRKKANGIIVPWMCFPPDIALPLRDE